MKLCIAQKLGQKAMNGALFAGIVILSLAGCSHTPYEKALASDPDIFAQAVNRALPKMVGIIPDEQCVYLIFHPETLEDVARKADFHVKPKEAAQFCQSFVRNLADSLNYVTDFKNLTQKDIEQKAFWKHYFQSSLAEFKVKDGQ